MFSTAQNTQSVEGESHSPFLHNLSEYQKMKRCECGGLFCDGGWLAVTKTIALPLQLTASPYSQTPLQSAMSVCLCVSQWNVDRSEANHEV